MSTDYNYDEQGQFFPYFVITVTAIFTIPLTYSAFKPSKQLENTAIRIPSDFRPDHEDLINKQRRKQKRRERKLKRMLASAAGWLVMAWMVYLMVVTTRTAPKVYDPYEILGLSRSASESQIRKHYKKLSIVEHPDKRQPDPSKNETIQSINDHWVDVVKAYKTLTDEEVRNNYIQFGHPDGKQSFSIGIALPQFIVTEGNGKYVLLLYAMLLGVLLPFLVGRWWYGTQRMTRDGILVNSASKLFTEYKEEMAENNVINTLSSGSEYEERLDNKKGDRSSSKVESKLLGPETTVKTFGRSDREHLSSMGDEQRRLVSALLWAYLHRIDLKDPQLDEQKYEVAPIAFALNEAFQNMTLAFGNTAPLMASMHTSQRLIQAMPPNSSPLLQLPHFTPAVIAAVTAKNGTEITSSLTAFMSLTEAKRRALTVSSNLLTQQQYSTAMSVAAQLPHGRIERAFFKVVGEKVITPGSLVQFVVKLRFIPPGTDSAIIPAVAAQDLEDPDPKEGDLDALHGRKKTTKKGKDGKPVTVTATEERVQPPLAHAPFFAQDHAPRWRIFLADTRQGKIAVPPFTFSTFDSALFSTTGASVTPTFGVQTLKMQFQAPPGVGQYNFTMQLVCDSYVGLDSSMDVAMVVEEMAAAAEIEEEEEISEPEEDSLAGQMAALKGAATGAAGAGDTEGGEKPKAKRKVVRKRVVQEESDDDSDTDGAADSDSDTDTDTDTDEE